MSDWPRAARRDKAVRKIEARDSIDTAHRAKQICGQIFRYAAAVGLAERDMTTDLRGALAAIPASKMKMKVDHLVPLSTQAVALLRNVQPVTGHGRYVFPCLRTGERPMSENTINAAMGYSKEVHTAGDVVEIGLE